MSQSTGLEEGGGAKSSGLGSVTNRLYELQKVNEIRWISHFPQPTHAFSSKSCESIIADLAFINIIFQEDKIPVHAKAFLK